MNNCTFVGRLGKDAEIKELEGGKKVLNFSIAVDDGKDRPAIWISCAKWSEKTAVAQYLTKGTQVAVSGTINLRKWESQNGMGAELTLRVNDIRLIGGKPANEQSTGNSANESQQSAAIQEPTIDELSQDLPF